MSTAVVPGRDAPPILEPAEHAFDEIAVLVPFLVVFDRVLAPFPSGDAGFDVPAFKRGAEPVGVIAAIRDQEVGIRQGGGACSPPPCSR